MASIRKINPPFRAEHVGSFLRPEKLLKARDAAGMGQTMFDLQDAKLEESTGALKNIEDECIRELVALEEDIGLQVITDGEFRRNSWAYDFIAMIDGIELKPQVGGAFQAAFAGSGAKSPIAHAVDKVKRRPGGLHLPNFQFLKDLTDRTIKITMPSPTLMYVRGGRSAVDQTVYPDIEEYFEDVTGVYREEIAGLAEAGCTYVQIDNTDVAFLCDPKFQEISRSLGWEPEEQLDIQGMLINKSIRDKPADMTIAMHMCRGNGAGNWMAEGGYEAVAQKLFSVFDVDAFFMEYDTERAGGFEPLRYAPNDKLIVLGLVTTKTPENDDKETLKRRIDEAAQFVPVENLALSPQCGFASVAEGNPITLDDQRRKLELILETAEEVWGNA